MGARKSCPTARVPWDRMPLMRPSSSTLYTNSGGCAKTVASPCQVADGQKYTCGNSCMWPKATTCGDIQANYLNLDWARFKELNSFCTSQTNAIAEGKRVCMAGACG